MSQTSTVDSLILAAGGIVERRTADGVEIAIVHRTRHGGEWSLPKGKLDDGESPEHAALREVKEETGFNVQLGKFAGSISYPDGVREKHILFWRMPAVEPYEFHPSAEVDEVRWLAPDQAVQEVSYREQARLISEVFGLVAKEDGGPFSKIRKTGFFRSSRADRLEATLVVYSRDIERRISEVRKTGANPSWIDESRLLLSRATLALRIGELDQGWRCLNAAKRMEIYGLKSGPELNAVAATIRAESEKLGSWRKKAVDSLLGTTERPEPQMTNDAVHTAAAIRDEHNDNQAYKSRLQRTFLLHISILYASSLAVLLLLLILGYLPASLGEDEDDVRALFLGVAWFGLFGALFSAMLKQTTQTTSARIPEMTAAFRVTIIRILVGSGSAIMLFIIMKAGVSGIFNQSIEGILSSSNNVYLIYFLAFVAGFTERLVLKAIEFVDKKA